MIKLLSRPIDRAILIYFRIMTGILISQELINGLLIGKFAEYTLPKFHFSYLFFEWIKPWSQEGMTLHYVVTIFSGFLVAAGISYRLSSIILFLGYSSLFLMEQAEYINHSYLYCLMSFWMIFLPLKNDGRSTAPAWCLYLILFHMSLAYFFGGIAKLNPDWLVGTPMNLFLKARTHFPLGFIYQQEWAPLVFSYGGILFDLLVVPLMIFPRTRLIGLAFSIVFHLSNVLMFGLATFPWYSLVLTTMFFDPSWPRKIPGLKKFMPKLSRAKERPLSPILITILGIYTFVHLLLPFRHLLYPGNPSWTEQGHMFSWRMMLRDKEGTVSFIVKDKSQSRFYPIKLRDYLTERQIKDMTGKPDLILQFSHFLKKVYAEKLNSDVSVFASSRVSLNGRPKKEMIKPGTDLGQEERRFGHYNWINPLEDETELVTTK